MSKHAKCAEIGVWKGDYSRIILKYTHPKELHLIDPWLFDPSLPERWWGGKIAKGQDFMEDMYNSVKSEFGSKDNVYFHRKTSVEALSGFDDAYFDWIYIDGDHTYEGVLQDLTLSWQKIKSGGCILGDDYYLGAEVGFPIKRAVEDFIALHNPKKFKVYARQFVLRK
jgi:hypothetical protein